MLMTRFSSAALTLCLLLCSCSVGAERGPANQQEGQKSGTASPQSGQSQSEQSQSGQSRSEQAAKPPRAPVDPNKFALIIAGVGGEETYKKRFTEQALKLHDALVNRLGFDEKHTYLLMETVNGGPENDLRENVARSTSEEVRKAFGAIKAAANSDSLVFILLIGHGSFDTQEAKFNLIGPDLTAKDYAALLKEFPSKRVVFVDTTSSSGEFVKPLSGPNRIVITATRSGNEQNATIFAEYFIDALTNEAADTDKNNRISVLEAFDYATHLVADKYNEQKRLATEHALLDDNGDGTGHEESKEGDGALAKTTYLDSRQIEQAGGDAEVARLLAERQRLEEEVEKLKTRKSEMKPEEYEAELERLLLELAGVNQQIKAKQK